MITERDEELMLSALETYGNAIEGLNKEYQSGFDAAVRIVRDKMHTNKVGYYDMEQMCNYCKSINDNENVKKEYDRLLDYLLRMNVRNNRHIKKEIKNANKQRKIKNAKIARA